MKTQLDQKGFALAVVLLFVLAIGCATAALVPRALRWQHAAIVQYETDCLASDLRLMQQMARTAAVYPIEETSEHGLSEAAPALEIRDEEHAYMIWRYTYVGSRPKSSLLVRHAYPEALNISANTKGRIQYGRNGGTANMTTIYVFYTGEMERGKKIILDSVGRIRVEAMNGKNTP